MSEHVGRILRLFRCAGRHPCIRLIFLSIPSLVRQADWQRADRAYRPLCLMLLIVAFGMTDANALDVVANRSVPDAVLKRSVAWAVFSMRLRTWSDGTPTTVFVLSDNNPLHAEFSKEILETFPYQLRRAWDRLVFSGTGQAPTEVDSLKEMHDRVLSTPGAVGYLPPAMIDPGMKTVRVE